MSYLMPTRSDVSVAVSDTGGPELLHPDVVHEHLGAATDMAGAALLRTE
jgi:hypothetical protein